MKKSSVNAISSQKRIILRKKVDVYNENGSGYICCCCVKSIFSWMGSFIGVEQQGDGIICFRCLPEEVENFDDIMRNIKNVYHKKVDKLKIKQIVDSSVKETLISLSDDEPPSMTISSRNLKRKRFVNKIY